MVDKQSISRLEKRLGVRLGDRRAAVEALTHRSWLNEHPDAGHRDNERLEFLGDAVIDVVVSQRLMERFPEAPEGVLSRLRASLVDESTLAKVARSIDLGSFLQLGRGEDRTGGREKASVLADALEAVIGAVFVGGGLSPCYDVVDRLFEESFEGLAEGQPDRDYKSQLQEWAQGKLGTQPRYRLAEARGPDHAKSFVVDLLLEDRVVGRGEGRSKKDAEQQAAKEALAKLGSFPLPGEGAGR